MAAPAQSVGARTDINRVARRLFTPMPARYDRLAFLLSFGQDRRWRRAVVDRIVAASPAVVLDVATGPAGVALAIAARSPARIVGVDLTEAMLREGVANVRRAGQQSRMHLALARGERLPFRDGTFDAISFSYLLRYVDDPAGTVAELARCLRPGGTLASLEFHVPPNALWRAAWVLYTRLLLPVLGLLTGGRPWWRVGRFLGPSISGHYLRFPLQAHVEAWQAAGLVDVDVRLMSLGGGLVMSARKRDASAP
jgi:demethylmenaquinone methyltransferase/2-methoxy-6-polyprenyl-1,4-benzoquinol methylase